MDYLKDENYYSDLYDLRTVKECLGSHESAIKVPPQKTKESKVRAISLTIDIFTYYVKGERFRNKFGTINEWMKKDKEKDDRVEKASTPQNIYCDFCSSKMEMTMKHLHSDDIRVMFWFECPKGCKRRKAIFDNGEEYKPKPNLCPKCSSEVKEISKKDGEIITTNIACPNCNYKTKEIMDFGKDRKEWAEEQRQDQELLEKFRSKYCMTDKEGQEYISHVENMKHFVALMKETEEKQKDPAYQQARQVKKISVVELEKLLNETFEKEKYIKLIFDKPELDRFVIIPFTVQDSDSKQEENDSRNKLKKLIIKTLEGSNWRLMSEGITYRLGYLSGKLKGYEREDDLAKFIKGEEQ